MAQLAADEADEDEEFVPLELKRKIHEFKEQNPKAEISQELMSEAFRWRLSQNDCQNRGYILDGYPISYQTTYDVFYITPPPREKKPPVLDEDGIEQPAEEEDIDPEELKKMMAPKFQQHIYPDSVIMLRGSYDTLAGRAKKADDGRDFGAAYDKYNKDNNLSDNGTPFHHPNPGHPLAPKHVYPMSRFFQENKTEVFEIYTDGNEFEIFESMRIYIERNGRSYNYLRSVGVLNVHREKALLQEEKTTKQRKAEDIKLEEEQKSSEQKALEKLQEQRLVHVKKHIDDLDECSKMNMRQFLMKQVIPVLTEGMIDVYRVGPTDPVDHLADYIFKRSNELRKG